MKRSLSVSVRAEAGRKRRLLDLSLALFSLLLAPCVAMMFAGAASADSDATKLLKLRSAEFKKDIIRLSDNVYTSVGYGVSTVSMIIGDDGVIIIDAGIDTVSGAEIRRDFREITDKPVRAVVITHGHPDHYGGLAAFVDSEDVQVWVRKGFQSESNFLYEGGIYQQRKRGALQAGFLLTAEERINNGIAKPYWPSRGGAVFESTYSAKPTHFTTEKRTRLAVAGIDLDLVQVEGETDDHLYIWYPTERILFAGDNFYKSWPNLYAIRGSAYRDVRKWAQAVDEMLQEGPSVVVAGHTRPVVGADAVTDTLTNYRDAIQFLFDKTVEGINKGLTPNQLVDYVVLPEKYQKLDYLRPYYGNPEWAVRSIFNGYLGWFDGNATNLFPLSDPEEARRIAKLAGGVSELHAQSVQALEERDYQWVLHLCDYLLALEPDSREAKLRKADAMTALADEVLTATARNYYLGRAKQLRASVAE
ncbi:MAG: alkyl/aryl-sulfatase [Pseudomonadota bacterium]